MPKPNKPFEFDYEAVKNKALAQLKTGQPLLGKEGALAPLFKSFLEAALEAELENHLQENKEDEINRRNGHGSKQLRTSERCILMCHIANFLIKQPGEKISLQPGRECRKKVKAVRFQPVQSNPSEIVK
jgi:hypothetical protein